MTDHRRQAHRRPAKGRSIVSTIWNDATSYSRGERGTVEPRIWAIDDDGMRVVVHRLHGVNGLWFGTCHVMGVDNHQLRATDIDTAQREFLGYLFGRTTRWVSRLHHLLILGDPEARKKNR